MFREAKQSDKSVHKVFYTLACRRQEWACSVSPQCYVRALFRCTCVRLSPEFYRCRSLHQVYIHLYVGVALRAPNFDTFYATKFKFGIILTKSNPFVFMVQQILRLDPGWDQGSECIIGHVAIMQSGNKIRSLVLLIALANQKLSLMITDEMGNTETMVQQLDQARSGFMGWGKRAGVKVGAKENFCHCCSNHSYKPIFMQLCKCH